MYDEYSVKEFLRKVREDITLEEFVARMEMISPESKKILIDRWGLEQWHFPAGPAVLNGVYKTTNAKEFVKASMSEFTYMKYVSYVKDRETLGIVLSHNLGYLIERASKINPNMFPNLGPDTICGLELLEQIENLKSNRMKEILKYTYGLMEDETTEILTLKVVGEAYGLSASRISSILCKAYRMLGYKMRKDAFFTMPEEEVSNGEQSKEIPTNLSVLISNSIFIQQMEIIKEKAIIDNIEQLKNMEPADLAELTGLEIEVCAFWILMAKNFKKRSIYKSLECNIEELCLKKRTRLALMRAGIKTIREFLELTLFEAKNIPNVGEKALEEIIRKREYLGIPIK